MPPFGVTEQLMHRNLEREILENFIFDLHQLYEVDYDLQINFFRILDSTLRHSSYSVPPFINRPNA